MSLSKEWIFVLALGSVPLLLFGVAEIVGIVRKRRLEAVARRSKSRLPDRARSKRKMTASSRW
jgi:hypothetical protein